MGFKASIATRVIPSLAELLALSGISEAKQNPVAANTLRGRLYQLIEVAMLAHELRNPLAPISSAAQVLSAAKHDEGQVKRVGEIIGRQAGHMTALVDDLLDAARFARG